MDRDLFFVNEVNEVSINRLIQDIQKLRGSTEAIRLFVCSPGGTGRLGVCFYEWIKSEKINLSTIATGFVASAAIYIFLAGEVRKATPHNTFLVHPGGGSVKEKITKIITKLVVPGLVRENVEVDECFVKERVDILTKETTLSPREATLYLTKKHLILNASQAQERRLVNEII